MAQALRRVWKANRHWVAAGFLGSTSFFLLLMFLNWRSEQLGIAMQEATGLAATRWDSLTMRRQESILPPFHPRKQVRAIRYASGTIGGVVGGLGGAALDAGELAPQSDKADRQVTRSGTLEIVVTDPLHAAEELRKLAANISGFVVSSKVSGSDQRTRSAQGCHPHSRRPL